MENTQKAPLLLFVEDDFIFGLQNEMYPDVQKQIDLGNIEIRSCNESSFFNLKGQLLGDGSDMFLLNKYSNQYERMADADLLNSLIGDQNFATKEAFVRMGAKKIKITSQQTTIDIKNINASSDTKTKGGNASVTFQGAWNARVDIDVQLSFCDHSNEPSNLEDVDLFIREHGLANDTKIRMLFERLKERKKLSGSERYDITYLSEVDDAIKTSLSINAFAFNEQLNFEKSSKHSLKKHYTLEIDF